MPAPIKVVFVAEGQAAVESAFKSVAQKAKELAQVQAVAARKSSKDQEQAANTNARSAEANARMIDRIKERSAIMAGKIAEKQAREETRARERAAKDAERIEQQKVKAVERAAQAQSRAAARAQRDTERAARAAAKEQERSAEHAAAAQERAATKAARATAREAAKITGASNRQATGVSGIFGRAGRSTMGTVTGVAGGLGIAGGGALIGGALMDAVALRGQAALLANATRMKAGEKPYDPDMLVKSAQSTATATGFKAEDVMGAMNTVAARAGGRSGLQSFLGDLDDISKTARAAGVSMEDLGSVYAAALNAGVKPGEEARQLMMDLVQVGKAGAVEFKDLAGELAKLGGIGKMTSLTGGQMMRRQVGLAQVAVEAAVSPEESRTAVVDMIRDINTHAHSLKGAGINVYDKNGKVNDPAEIIAASMETAFGKGFNVKGRGQVHGSEALSAIFTGTSLKVISGLMDTFQGAGGGAKGRAAVLARINEAGGATMTKSMRDEEYALANGGPGAALAKGMEEFKAKISELLPAFTQLVPTALKAAEALAKLTVWAAQNPLEGVGALFAAALTKEVAGAGAGKAMEAGLQSIFANAGGSFKGSLTLGNITAAAPIAMTAAMVYLVGKQVIDQISDAGAKQGQTAFAADIETGNLKRKIAMQGGVALPEDISKAQALQSQVQATGTEDTPLWAKAANLLAGTALMAASYATTGQAPAQALMGSAYGEGNVAKQDKQANLDALQAIIQLGNAAKDASQKLSSLPGGIADPNAGARNDPASRAGIR